jgi:hypothetical protein
VAIIVIGGHSRSVGKTSVVAGLISALRDYEWTAVKITQYGHGVCSAKGAPCDCATSDHMWAISEEPKPHAPLSEEHNGSRENNERKLSDTARFLLAGASRALWARTEQGRLAEAMPALRKRLEQSQHVIIESNSVMKFLRPDLYLPVLDPTTVDFKNSAREFMDRASAIILHHAADEKPAWQGVSLKPAARLPVFRITPPSYVTPEIVKFVRSRLSAPDLNTERRS